MKYTIYKHTNKINGKSYIGWTILSMQEKWQDHLISANAGSDFVFHKAIRKYSDHDVWIHEILDVVCSLEMALKTEMLWIAHYNTNCYKGFEYNMTDGGQGSTGRKHSEIAKNKISLKRIENGVAKILEQQ